MSLAPGQRLGPYEILAPLGAGGMGEVYRAHDPRLGRDVAIKVLPSAYSGDADRLRRFQQEARAAGTLNHPNILAIYDIGTHEGSPFVVSELLEGETLRDRLQEGPLAPRKGIEYASQIARGLAAAHEKGIVHRDLKPENLFVTRDGHVKILDFGLAKLIHPEEDGSSLTKLPTTPPETHPGVVLGTASYMSPEQVRGLPLGHRSDIFSLGAILYEMLSGKRAFQRGTAADTMAAILKEDPPELSASNAGISPVSHCIEKEPERRFQSARDAGFALESLSGLSSSGPQTVALPEPPRKRWLLPATITTTFVLGVAAAFLAGRGMQVGSSKPQLTFRELTFRRQAIFNARFAPDGVTVVYSGALQANIPEIFSIRSEYPEPRAMDLHDAHLLSVASTGELAVLTGARFLGHRLFLGTRRLDAGAGARAPPRGERQGPAGIPHREGPR